MRYILDCCLNVFSKAVGDVSLFLANMSTGTISWAGIYEPEMPTALHPKENEESE